MCFHASFVPGYGAGGKQPLSGYKRASRIAADNSVPKCQDFDVPKSDAMIGPGSVQMFRVFGALIILIATPAMAADNIEKAVKACVEVAHSAGYEYFDAYYNSASKSVENNITYVYQQSALFPFNKCMASQGFPLTYPDKR